jgi:hypothetical protein
MNNEISILNFWSPSVPFPLFVPIDKCIPWCYRYKTKTRIFQRWAVKENISDKILNKAIEEFVEGLYEAKLGKGLYKKRIPHKGKGKRGGARSILFYLTGKVLIFCIGYPKNVQEDLNKL